MAVADCLNKYHNVCVLNMSSVLSWNNPLTVVGRRDMEPEQLKQKVRTITVWRRGAQRAPHKPLLLLYALGKCVRGEPREIPYAEVDQQLRELLIEFGPERKSCHPEYPFWRLQNDGIWELSHADNVERRRSSTDAKKSELLKHGVKGGFLTEVYDMLRSDPKLATGLAIEILSRHFPMTLYGDILQAVGLDVQLEQTLRRRRDPNFRTRVLRAYEYRCAVCGYDIRLGNREVALEAAHIKWHQAGGPDVESNGLALCALHHKLFDRGAFTLSPHFLISVSQFVHGTQGVSEWLLAFNGRLLRQPQCREYLPDEVYMKWHGREVFRGPARGFPTTALNA